MSIPTGYDAQTGQMDFSLALREMKKGKKVRRASWEHIRWLSIHDGNFVDDKKFSVRLSTQAILATDWEEVL